MKVKIKLPSDDEIKMLLADHICNAIEFEFFHKDEPFDFQRVENELHVVHKKTGRRFELQLWEIR